LKEEGPTGPSLANHEPVRRERVGWDWEIRYDDQITTETNSVMTGCPRYVLNISSSGECLYGTAGDRRHILAQFAYFSAGF